MFDAEIKKTMDENIPLSHKREYLLKELKEYLRFITQIEQNTKYLEKLIKRSKKRYSRDLWFSIKGSD